MGDKKREVSLFKGKKVMNGHVVSRHPENRLQKQGA